MANFNHFYQSENKSSRIDYLFYLTSILLAASVFSYLIFAFKVGLQNRRVEEIEKKSLSLGTEARQAYNKKILDYKKNIDDFDVILDSHKITSNIFTFLEKNTISNVWFLNFNMQEGIDEVRLSGEAESMDALSKQVKVFEESQDYIDEVNVLSSESNLSGRIDFTLNVFFNPNIFSSEQGIL